MKTKDLKINFRYLGGNIACLSVDSIDGKSIHNDINNEEAIIIFNSIVGEKENCQTVKTLLQENQELKEKLDKYENPKDMTLFAMWCTEKVKEENQKLKNQLEEYKDNYNCLLKQKEQFEYIMSKQVDYRGQQKEFIEWLEYKIDICDSFLDTIKSDLQETPYGVISANKDITTRIKENETAHKVYKEILQKYKEIIGVEDESR